MSIAERLAVCLRFAASPTQVAQCRIRARAPQPAPPAAQGAERPKDASKQVALVPPEKPVVSHPELKQDGSRLTPEEASRGLCPALLLRLG